MVIQYGFYMGGPATADQVRDVLAHTAAAHTMLTEPGARFDLPGVELRSGLLVSLGASTPLPFLDPIEEEFGFAPALDIVFRFDKQADWVEQDQDMIRLVAAVLTALPGDAWLAHQRETTWLLRLGGKLTISEADHQWTQEEIALLPPHDRAKLPNL